MSTGPAIDSVRARRPVRVLPIVGAALAAACLALAIAAGPTGSPVPSLVTAAAAVAVLMVEISRRAVPVARSAEGRLLVVGTLVLTAAALALVTLGLSFAAIVGGLLALVGATLVVRGVDAFRALRSATPTPWTSIRGISAHDRSDLLVHTLGPAASGTILVLMALRIHGPAMFLAVCAVAVAVVVRGSSRQTTGLPAFVPEPRTTVHLRSREDVAAHLHDSVLQTLALIQRNADDPARVAQLARQQERSLRDWLAGRQELGPATLPAALRIVAEEVEAEIAGTAVEVVCVGEAPMDRRVEMLTQAAREAIRNAARHGSPTVRVFCESDASGTSVFVRDAGPGLRLDAVPDDRRGIRDAIIGRMEHVDGTVVIDSGDEGTEITLTLPNRPAT